MAEMIGAGYKRAALAAFLVLSAWLSYSAHQLENSLEEADRVADQSEMIGMRAPGFSLPVLEAGGDWTEDWVQKRVSLADMEGKVVVISFWASWCRPCDFELPFVNQFYLKNRGRGVEVVAISVDKHREDAVRYRQNRDYAFPMVWDETGQADNEYKIEALPTLIVVGPDGVVHFRQEGLSRNLEVQLNRWISSLNSSDGEEEQ